MHTELEVKILDIDISTIEAKLQALGAEKVMERAMRRYTYDLVQDQEGVEKWARLRDNGQETTLAVKMIHHDGIDGTKETEVVVDDLEAAHLLMQQLGHREWKYQENRRISYRLGEVDIEIDTWPLIPSYLEIEGPEVGEIETVVKQLGYTMTDTTSIGVSKVFAHYGYDILAMQSLTFDGVQY